MLSLSKNPTQEGATAVTGENEEEEEGEGEIEEGRRGGGRRDNKEGRSKNKGRHENNKVVRRKLEERVRFEG